ILGITKVSSLSFFSDKALEENFNVYIDVDSHTLCLRLPHDRAFVIVDTQIAIKYWQKLATTAIITNEVVWDWFDIQAGIPQLTASTTEFFLPHYLNLPQLGGVNFEKGCYLGQEIIARMQYRGHIKKHLYRAKIATKHAVEPGQEIHNETGQVVGNIVKAVVEENQVFCLISAQDESITQSLFLSGTQDFFYEIMDAAN
ncbi:MAG TPA: tRNA-modifying protein YgfZ, partial [Gammaproteobacteria bacterium]|nr:tRNA-modifying protein YgfZ [Gammaproteobacteria bacterium]